MIIKIEKTINKYGYTSIDLVVNDKKYFISRGFSRFELNYLANRYNNLYVDVVCETYKGENYYNLVIKEINGYDDEYVVIKGGLDYQFKNFLITEILAEKVGI